MGTAIQMGQQTRPTQQHGWPAKVVSVLTGGDVDDDSTVSIRYNGRRFNIHMSPRFFLNSPNASVLYFKYLQAIDPEGPGEFEDVTEEDVFGWLTDLFHQLFVELAPEPPPAYDPQKIKDGEVNPVLSDYLFPETFGCRLDAVDDVFQPRHTDNHGGLVTPRNWLDEETIADWQTWTKVFEPSQVNAYFDKPEHVLSRMPTKVSVNLDGSSHKTTCFYKGFGMSGWGDHLYRELDAYRLIQDEAFSKTANVCRLIGVVHEHDRGSTLGLLLRHIANKGILDDAIEDDPPLELRSRWEWQITEALKELHRVRAVWGDAKPGNVLIDCDDNAWLVDFEGGYTRPWVDSEKTGTVEGDLQAWEKMVKFIYQRPGYGHDEVIEGEQVR